MSMSMPTATSLSSQNPQIAKPKIVMSMSMPTATSLPSKNPQTAKLKIVRRTAKFQPSIWGDQFLKYDSQYTKTEALWQQQIDELKLVVKREVCRDESDFSLRLNLIDAIQRLGVAYHFEKEIDEALQHIHATYHRQEHYRDDGDLHNVALGFRLLRQHGYDISSDVFNKFKDANGCFKESLVADPSGMLSLYEATHLRVHREGILEEALVFTTTHLESAKNNACYPEQLREQITQALGRPLRKSLDRLCAKRYMSIYQDAHQASHKHNEALLKFAKLDFNLVQSLHRKELCDITRWWKDQGFERKLPFARERVAELFFWVVGVYFEPQFATGRSIMTKMAALVTLMDDIYDAYGTFEELEIFTEAIHRWDVKCIDELPDFMKILYHQLLNLFKEIDELMLKEGRSCQVCYGIQALKNQARSYLDEVKWLHEGRIPSMEEYMGVATVSITYTFLITISLLVMGNTATKETLEWLSNDPKILRASNIIFRLMNDIFSSQFEKERGHAPSSIDCYMKQYGVSEQETVDVFNKKIADSWKDINEEFLAPTAMPRTVLMSFLNLNRVVDLLYKGEDGFTQVGKMTKDNVVALFIDPVPL